MINRALTALAVLIALALTPMDFVDGGLKPAVLLQTSADWPQWRGPNRDGSVLAALPSQWPQTLNKRWEIPVGAGHASPVISGNRVVVIARQNDQEIVRALDLASGKEIWRASYPAPYTVNSAAWAHGPGPKSTPAIAGGRVFTFGIGGILSAFDLANGTLLWRVPAPTVLPQYGTASSPLIDGTSVIVHVGGYENGALTSLDAATGKPRWQWKGDGPGSGSPIIATFGGVRQVIAQTQKFLVGLNASTGALLWQLPFTDDFNQNAFTPVVFQDLLINSGIDAPLTAVRPKLVDGKWTVETVWTNPQTPMFMSSPVLIGGTIYGLAFRSKGQFVAIDAKSGKTLWNTQGREGDNASMMGSRSWLLASTTDGNLVVARVNPQKYEEVRRYQIAPSAVWAHPAMTGSSIIVKDVDKVICWGFATLSASAPAAQSIPKSGIAARIDSLARAQLAGGLVSISIAVNRKDDVLFEGAYGMADIATERPAHTASVYRITGASMQFTAALVLKQIERGRIAIDDPIGRHLTTGLPPEWRPITIEQLLSHTSGLAGSITRDTAPEQPASTATLIAWAARDRLKFPPGSSFSYSRVGYLLLGALVEKLYGKSYDAVLRDEIARPLGLTTLGWCADAGKDTLEATGYEEVSPGNRRPVSNLHPSKELGAGGLCATAGDLNAWTRALHGGRVLSSTSYATFTTSIKSLERPAIAECCFMVVPRARGVARLTLHREDGFATEIAWFTRDSLSVTVLYNTSGQGIIGLLPLEIADAVTKAAKRVPGRTPYDAGVFTTVQVLSGS